MKTIQKFFLTFDRSPGCLSLDFFPALAQGPTLVT